MPVLTLIRLALISPKLWGELLQMIKTMLTLITLLINHGKKKKKKSRPFEATPISAMSLQRDNTIKCNPCFSFASARTDKPDGIQKLINY